MKLTSAYKLKILAEHSYHQLSVYFAKVRIKDVKDELKTEVKIKDEIEDSLLEVAVKDEVVEGEEWKGEGGAEESDYFDEDDNLPLVFARPTKIPVPPKKATKRKYKG